MRTIRNITLALSLTPLLALGACASTCTPPAPATGAPTMDLGVFSLSLAVKDLAASRTFYEKLGFAQVGGDEAMNYLILRNGDTIIGLFQGMFEGNILTFNPGWDADKNTLDSFTDVRELHARLTGTGIATVQEAGLDSDGAGSLVIVDPDGNAVLIDQHVPKPGAE